VVPAKRARANLDMRGGPGRNDDGVGLRFVDQPQRIGKAIHRAVARAGQIECGGIGIGRANRFHV
jgi:hypothetical protein